MADDISIFVKVVGQKDIVATTNSLNKLEAGVKRLSNDLSKGRISNTQYTTGLRELRKSVDSSFGSWQKAKSAVDQYSKQVQQAQAIQKQSQAAIKAEAQALKEYRQARREATAENQRFDAEQRKAVRTAREAATANRRLRMEFREGYAAKVQLRAAQMRLSQAMRKGIIDADQYEAQLQQLTAAQQQLGNAAQLGGRRTNSFGMLTQQAGYQVGDFLVQVQGGTNVMVAFGQQATQMIGAFNLLPASTLAATVGIGAFRISMLALIASLGIIIPLATAIGAYFMRTRAAAQEAAGGVDTLKDAMDSLRSSSVNLEVELAKMRFGTDSSEMAKGLIQQEMLTRELAEAQREYSDAIAEAAENEFSLQKAGESGRAAQRVQELREQLELLDAEIDRNRRLAEQEANKRAAQELFNTNLQQEIDLVRERNAAVDQIRDSLDRQLQSLDSQITLNKEILRFGEDSAEVAALRAEQEREAFILQQKSEGILGNNLNTVMDQYDVLVQTTSELAQAAAEAEKLANALNSAATFSGSLDANVAGLRARLAEARGEQGAVLALTVSQLEAEARSSAARAIAAGEDRLVANNRLAIDLAQIENMKTLTEEIDSLADATRGGGRAVKEVEKKTKELANELDGPLKSAVDGVSNAFGEFVVRGFNDFQSFSSAILNSFKNLLTQMIAMAAKNRIMISLGMGGSVAGSAASAGISGALGSGIGGIGAGIVGVGSNLAAGATTALGLGGAFTGSFGAGLGATMTGGLAGGASAFGTGVGMMGTAGMAGSGAAMALGAAIPVLGAVALAVGLFRKKTKELDSGLNVTVKNMDALVESFRTVQTSRFFGLSKKTRTSTGAVSGAVSNPIVSAVEQIQQSVLTAASAFGIGADAFDNFSYKFKLSLKGLSEEQQMQKINEELTKMGDSFASLSGHFSNMNELLEAAEQRYQIENRMLQALGNSSELLARNRERELAATHALNRGLLQATFDLEDANAGVNNAIEVLRRAIDAEKQGLQDRASVINEALRQTKAVFDMLSNALKSRRLQDDASFRMRRSAAQSFLRAGDTSDTRALEEALGVVSEPSEGLFGSFVDYARDFLTTSRDIADLEKTAQVQLTIEEQMLAAIESQLESLDVQYQTQIDQYNALLGIDTSVKSVEQAIASLGSALKALASAQSAAKAAQAAGVGSVGGAVGGGSVKDVFGTGKKFQGYDLAQLRGSSDLLKAAQLAGVGTSGKTGAQIQQEITNATGLAVNMDNATRAKAFARGGMHSGGMRLVGEEGPELEVTGPSRIYSAQQTKGMLQGGGVDNVGLRAEVSELRSELRQLAIANNKYTKRSYDLFNKWDIDGLPATRT